MIYICHAWFIRQQLWLLRLDILPVVWWYNCANWIIELVLCNSFWAVCRTGFYPLNLNWTRKTNHFGGRVYVFFLILLSSRILDRGWSAGLLLWVITWWVPRVSILCAAFLVLVLDILSAYCAFVLLKFDLTLFWQIISMKIIQNLNYSSLKQVWNHQHNATCNFSYYKLQVFWNADLFSKRRLFLQEIWGKPQNLRE